MPVSLNKQLIQEASSCLRLARFRVRDREQGVERALSAADRVQLMYGEQVGRKAREAVTEGVLVGNETFSKALALTRRLMARGVKVLFSIQLGNFLP